jgi:hypothetical protein
MGFDEVPAAAFCCCTSIGILGSLVRLASDVELPGAAKKRPAWPDDLDAN